MRAAAVALVLLSGCGLTTMSRDYLAEKSRATCEAIYCSGYGQVGEPPIWDCPNRSDLVPICIEDYLRESREQLGWFSRLLLAVAEAF